MLCYATLCHAVLCSVALCCVVRCALLCCVVRCYAVLCYDVLSYVVLCCVVLCCALLCHAVLCYALLCYVGVFNDQKTRRHGWLIDQTPCKRILADQHLVCMGCLLIRNLTSRVVPHCGVVCCVVLCGGV